MKFGKTIHYEAATLYFTEESSYQAVGRELGIAPLTAFRWINKLGRNCKSFEQVAQELKPRQGGFFWPMERQSLSEEKSMPCSLR